MTSPAHVPGRELRPVDPTGRIDPFVMAVTLAAAAVMLAAGVFALVAPGSFADFVNFPDSEHFVHDAGAFQVGIGVMLVLALIWRDALAVALAAFLLTNTLHAINHAVDLDLGGRTSDAWLLSALSLATAVALARRLSQLGYVVGKVRAATTPTLAPFVDQKTAVLTTYRRDGTPIGTPLSVAVDGDRAYVRSYEKAGKTRRMRTNPAVGLAPSTTRGTATGSPVHGRTRRLDGAESEHAARLLASKHPALQGVVVPLAHRLLRAKTGRTVHFELIPVDLEPPSPAEPSG